MIMGVDIWWMAGDNTTGEGEVNELKYQAVRKVYGETVIKNSDGNTVLSSASMLL